MDKYFVAFLIIMLFAILFFVVREGFFNKDIDECKGNVRLQYEQLMKKVYENEKN